MRFGGRAKALLPVGSESVLGRMIRIVRNAELDPVIVVVGAHSREIAASVARDDVRIVENLAWAEGRTGSVQRGIREADGSDALLWPVDHPFALERTVRTLLASLGRDDLAVWTIPTFEGRGGHPVLIRSAAHTAVLDLPRNAPLRSLLPKLGPQVRRIPVGDPGVVAEADTPESYAHGYSEWIARGGETDGP
ncbi:MAG: NTP transferase domain-containing protein [Thermoplasmata archaeon]|nr:NTP transferase domain-containing protein [Thermoplasmata archaeon]